MATEPIMIPRYFADGIHRFFGAEGDAWFSHLDELLRACIRKWDLRDCQLADNLSVNLICFAISPLYGPVVLKIGFPHPEFYSELAALSLYEGRNVCALYAADPELGAMLLERVQPGYNLKALPDGAERLHIALETITNLPLPVAPHPAIPAFSDWIDRAFSRLRREGKVDPHMLVYVEHVEQLFWEVTASEPDKYLLHGDLHHENILYSTGSSLHGDLHHENILHSADGSWVVIDPKGVTGIACLEAGRYILNAVEFVPAPRQIEVLEKLVDAFAGAFRKPRRKIAICALVDCVLSRTWTFEEYLTPQAFQREMAEALRLFPIYLDCVNRC